MIMKKIICCFLLVIVGLSCKDDIPREFDPFDQLAAYSYLETNDDYSEWAKLITHAGLAKSMNLKTIALTCFIADNKAVKRYLDKLEVSSVENIDAKDALKIVLYHTVQGGKYIFSSFKDGRLVDTTSSGDYLTTIFKDEGVFINGEIPLVKWDIEVINGVIHEVEEVLDYREIEGTMLDFIKRDESRYSIFLDALELTRTDTLLNIMHCDIYNKRYRKGLFIIPNEVYIAANIGDAAVLAEKIAPGTSDYTSRSNPLNRYMRYHMLRANYTTLEFSQLLTERKIGDNDSKGTLLHTLMEDAIIHLAALGGLLTLNPDEENKGANLLEGQYNMQVKNGMIHELNNLLFEKVPPPLKYAHDFVDYATYPNMLNIKNYRRDAALFLTNLKKEDFAPAIKWESIPAVKNDAVSYKIHTPEPYSWSVGALYSDGIFANLGPVGYIEFKFPAIPPGSYKLSIAYFKMKNVGGNFQSSLDGKEIGEIVKCYQPATGYDGWDIAALGNITFLTMEEHTFRCDVVKGGEISIDRIWFEPIL